MLSDSIVDNSGTRLARIFYQCSGLASEVWLHSKGLSLVLGCPFTSPLWPEKTTNQETVVGTTTYMNSNHVLPGPKKRANN